MTYFVFLAAIAALKVTMSVCKHFIIPPSFAMVCIKDIHCYSAINIQNLNSSKRFLAAIADL